MQKNNVKRYPLATAGKRIIAKALDIAIISCLVVALGFTIFCTDPDFHWNQALIIAGWRYGLFVTLVAVVFFGLMLLLPRLWGKTIGMKACNLAYHKTKECNHSFALFKHELFIWEIVVIIAFAMGWTLAGLNQHQIDSLLSGVNAIFANAAPEELDKVCYYAGTAFSCLYGVSIIFLIAIIVAVCIRSGRPAFHDKYSNIYVFYKKETIVNPHPLKKKEPESDIKVPGQLSDESLEEIDNI